MGSAPGTSSAPSMISEGGRREAADQRQEAGGRRQDAGGRRQEAIARHGGMLSVGQLAYCGIVWRGGSSCACRPAIEDMWAIPGAVDTVPVLRMPCDAMHARS